LNRVGAFLRSILPSDLTQSFFLSGSVFLSISSTLRCWPLEWSRLVINFGPIVSRSAGTPAAMAMVGWIHVVVWCQFLLFIGGGAGYFLCLWPGHRPIRNILAFVCLPACWAVSVVCVRFLMIAARPSFSLLVEAPRPKLHFVPWAVATLTDLGPGFHFAVLGMVCVAIFLSRLALGLTDLPVRLAIGSKPPGSGEVEMSRVWMFVWFSLTALFPTYLVVRLPFSGLSYWLQGYVVHGPVNLIVLVGCLAAGASGVAFAAWTVGSDRWIELRRFLMIRNPEYLALGLVFPVANWALVPLINYIHERVLWAATSFGKYAPPYLDSFFSMPRWWFLAGYLPWALSEEIVFRGYLQPRFLSRYGALPGLTILGAIWGASHFCTDFGRDQGDASVVLGIIWRIASCAAMGLVLGWLRMRSGSIWPSTVAHLVYNVHVYSNYFANYWIWLFTSIGFWALLAFILFRYWPPPAEVSVVDTPHVIAEPVL